MGSYFLTSLWLAVSTNVDNIGVGVAYGIKRIRIGAAANLLIACCNAAATYLSMKAGDTLAQVVPPAICSTVGSMTIVIVGLWALLNTFAFGGSDSEKSPEGKPQETIQLEYLSQHPEVLDLDQSGHVNVREALPLAFALSISNLATGMGARLAGLDVDFLVVLMFAFSLLGIIAGYYFGQFFSRALPKRWPGVLSGILLIIFGFYGLLSARN